RVAQLHAVVMVVDVGPKLDLLDLELLLLALGFVRLLLLRVQALAEIHDATDRRAPFRRRFDQVEPRFARDAQRLFRGDDPELSAFRVDDPNLADPDCLVDACRSVDALLPPSELHQRSVSPRCTGRSIRPRAGPCPAKLVNSS